MSAVPGYLTAQPRWLLWRTETKIDRKTGEKRTTKVPISFHTGKPCDVTAPASWTDYDKVEAALARTPGAWDGAGFALGVIEAIGEVVIGSISIPVLTRTAIPPSGRSSSWTRCGPMARSVLAASASS
jgi:primase-polymerase (primpol)-like protein